MQTARAFPDADFPHSYRARSLLDESGLGLGQGLKNNNGRHSQDFHRQFQPPHPVREILIDFVRLTSSRIHKLSGFPFNR